MTRTPPYPFHDVSAQVRRRWSLWGPNSGGGAFLAWLDEEVVQVEYGDTSDNGAEQVSLSTPVDAFIAQHRDEKGHWGIAARELAALRSTS